MSMTFGQHRSSGGPVGTSQYATSSSSTYRNRTARLNSINQLNNGTRSSYPKQSSGQNTARRPAGTSNGISARMHPSHSGRTHATGAAARTGAHGALPRLNLGNIRNAVHRSSVYGNAYNSPDTARRAYGRKNVHRTPRTQRKNSKYTSSTLRPHKLGQTVTGSFTARTLPKGINVNQYHAGGPPAGQPANISTHRMRALRKAKPLPDSKGSPRGVKKHSVVANSSTTNPNSGHSVGMPPSLTALQNSVEASARQYVHKVPHKPYRQKKTSLSSTHKHRSSKQNADLTLTAHADNSTFQPAVVSNNDVSQTDMTTKASSSSKAQQSKAKRKTKKKKSSSSSSTSAGTSSSASASASSSDHTLPLQNVPLPMTPAVAIKHHKDQLTPFEMSELLQYPTIYFCGNTKDKVKGMPHTSRNNGYDDDRGDYHIREHDHIAYRYEILSGLGKGSFGQVIKVYDHKHQRALALKLIRNKKRFHHQALIEVKILEHLNKKDVTGQAKIVRMYSYFYFRNHLCIAFELCGLNLYEYVKYNNFKGCSLDLTRKFAVQLLSGLKLLEDQKIVHCDLKPENILLQDPANKETDIKLVDFGSSCYENETVYTYIQSRFYRSPEVILGHRYGLPIDMWSLGCILAEMHTGYPIFPGEDEAEQMQCFMEVLGVPPSHVLQDATRRDKFFDEFGNPKLKANSRGRIRHPGSRDLGRSVQSKDREFLSFIRACLQWDASTRITASEAISHPWVAHQFKEYQQQAAASYRSRHSHNSLLKHDETENTISSEVGGVAL
jgi:dual specificity tyrosine-phosphorylation-regulated kinase 2/3/4